MEESRQDLIGCALLQVEDGSSGFIREFLGAHVCSNAHYGHGCSGSISGSNIEMVQRLRNTLVLKNQYNNGPWGSPKKSK